MKPVLSQHRTLQKRAWARRVLLKFGVVVVLGGGSILFALLSSRLQFTLTALSGNESIPTEEITRAVDQFLSKRVAWFFPQSSVALFRPRAFEAYLLKEFPRFSMADVSRSFSRELTLMVAERAPWGLYCKLSERDCYYIAEDGVLTAEAPQLTGNAVFRITDRRPNSAFFLLGDSVMNQEEADFLREAGNLLKDRYQVTVHEVMLGRMFEGQTELYTDEGWYVLFDNRTNKKQALENVALVLSQQITDRSSLEYIDARIEGKVFYKER